ncbi:TAXI family TRAP transporter solute-binding subunit [Pararhizobium mangrovi]|uniref:TAXI family TRAP transporter solute-binding subunit n=1 Tax=Pararhizobium mangrovi TaxID=2590452 RepID=A0A506TVL1_9HYPH|nr:TAXI family TRAP transporter solute-binding subunit [Pararhizobium mangrovi]TPW26103.1 TAXI family TRAP transporter solute-binding subunit [Pararhizobium mangrovi]
MKFVFPRSLMAGAVAAAVGLAGVPANAADFINILTGGTSGVYYPLGVQLSKIYSDNMDGVKVQVQSTKASVENMNLLQQGRGELAFALGDTVKAAWEGDKDAGFSQKLGKIRAIGAIYPNYVQIVATKASGIKNFQDLKGHSLSVGAPRSGTELNAKRIFDAMGMSYDDLSKTEYLPFGESVELMKNRQLDATLQSAGLGVASIKDLSSSMPIQVVSVPASVAEKLGAPFISTDIPAGTYDGQDKDVPTLAITNILVTREGVSDDMAYQMTKQLFEHLDSMVAAHSAAKAIDIQKAAQNLPIPLHPGAERYYKEKGVLK